MEGQVIAEVTVTPIGTADTGLSQYVAACLEVLEARQDLTYQFTAMGTIIQCSLDTAFEVVRRMHEVPFSKGISRVVTTLKIDDRRDKPATITSKVESVLELGRLSKA